MSKKLLNTRRQSVLGVEGRVAVIGGGNTALDSARVLLREGSEPVIIYRRGPDEMPAFPDEIREAREENIPIEYLKAPVKISKGNGGRLILTLVDMELGEHDGSGRGRPIPIAGSENDIEVDGVIKAIGEVGGVDNMSFMDGEESKGVEVLRAENIYIGGDVVNEKRTVAHAAADGKMVAIEMDMKLTKRGAAWPGGRVLSFKDYYHNRNSLELNPVAYEEINVDYFEGGKGVEPRDMDVRSRTRDFSEINMGLTGDEVKYEASRCFVCGRCIECGNCELFCPDFSVISLKEGIEIDYTYCKGCGICVMECPRGVITIGLD